MVKFDPAREPISPLVSSAAVLGVTARMCVRSRLIESQRNFANTPGNAKAPTWQKLSCENETQDVSRHDGGRG